MLRKIVLLVMLFISKFVFGNPAIEIEGLDRTKSSVIFTELELCNCLDRPDEVEQALLATGLFYQVQTVSENGRVQKIQLKERWTTIPIAKFNSGGGVQQSTIGVYDPNVFGRRIELGTQYESLAGAPSLVFWNKVPRLFESRFFSDLQLWQVQRARLKYDPSTNEPILIKALLQETERNYLAIGYEWNSHFKIRFGFETQRDQFSTARISQDTLNLVSGQIIPASSDVRFIIGQIDYGQLRTERHSPIGHLTYINFKSGFEQSNNKTRFHSIKAETSHFQLFDDLLFATRIQFGSTTSDLIQYWNYLGGLESIRGFADNRFATRNYWLLNLESRYYLLEQEKFILQSSGFLDLIGIDEKENELKNLHAASAGLGARVILPYFYRLTIRLDFAAPIVKKDDQRISFGVQQFF